MGFIFGYFQRLDLEEEPIDFHSCYEENNGIDEFVHIGRDDWDMQCFHFEGIPSMILRVKMILMNLEIMEILTYIF